MFTPSKQDTAAGVTHLPQGGQGQRDHVSHLVFHKPQRADPRHRNTPRTSHWDGDITRRPPALESWPDCLEDV